MQAVLGSKQGFLFRRKPCLTAAMGKPHPLNPPPPGRGILRRDWQPLQAGAPAAAAKPGSQIAGKRRWVALTPCLPLGTESPTP